MIAIAHKPAARLARLVEAIEYRVLPSGPTSRELVLPSSTVTPWVKLNNDEFRTYSGGDREIANSVPGAMLAGPSDRASVIELEGDREHICVTFAMGGAASFFKFPLTVARNETVPLGEAWGKAGATLRERVLHVESPEERIRVVERSSASN